MGRRAWGMGRAAEAADRATAPTAVERLARMVVMSLRAEAPSGLERRPCARHATLQAPGVEAIMSRPHELPEEEDSDGKDREAWFVVGARCEGGRAASSHCPGGRAGGVWCRGAPWSHRATGCQFG